MAVLKRVGLYYPAFLDRNKMSDKHQVNIGNLTDEHIDILVDELGVDEDQIKDPKTDLDDESKQEAADAQGRYIVARSEFPIQVVNGRREKLDDDYIRTIGNGSIANVQVNSYDWTFKKKSGVSAGLQQVMLLKKEDYAGFKDEFEEEDDELESAESFDSELEQEEDELD